MASLVRSESLTIWPWSVASFATQRFSSTISPVLLSRRDLISAGDAATRFIFCDARSDMFVLLWLGCCAHAAGESQRVGSKNPARAEKIQALVGALRAGRRMFSRSMSNLLRTGSYGAEC